MKIVYLPKVKYSITLSCHSYDTNKPIRNSIVMAPIDNHIEELIDNGLDVKIPLSDKVSVVVTPSKVLTYGDVDFKSDDDLDLFDRLNLKIDPFSGFNIPTNYNYETHSCICHDNKMHWYQTWDNIKIIRYKHGYLGKPKKVIVFKK